jgi:hypothetical protein
MLNSISCPVKIQNKQEKGKPNNMGLTECKIPNEFHCENEITFKTEILPKKYDEITSKVVLNESIYRDNMAPYFHEVYLPEQERYAYRSPDPRLMNVVCGQQLDIDTIPIDSSIKMSEIYTDPRMKNYGQRYKNYGDIRAGQIVYYVDESIQDPYATPNFVMKANVKSQLYQDPMSSIKPVYVREYKCEDKINSTRNKFKYGLSWLEDSTRHKEDLMSLQMSKMHEQSWMNRWKSEI